MTSSFRKSLTRKAPAAGAMVNGRWVEGSLASTTIKASVQPITPHDMMSMDVGRRNSRGFWLYTDTKLNSKGNGTNTNPDIIVIDGDDYEVVQVAPWQNNVLPHFRVAVMAVIEA